MTNQKRLCPVCRNEIAKTRGNNIGGHLDKAGTPCPGSYKVPYHLAIDASQPPTPTEYRKLLDEIHTMTARDTP